MDKITKLSNQKSSSLPPGCSARSTQDGDVIASRRWKDATGVGTSHRKGVSPQAARFNDDDREW